MVLTDKGRPEVGRREYRCRQGACNHLFFKTDTAEGLVPPGQPRPGALTNDQRLSNIGLVAR